MGVGQVVGVHGKNLVHRDRVQRQLGWLKTHQCTCFQHRHLIGPRWNERQVVQHRHNRDAKASNKTEQVGRSARVQVVGGLVQQQQLGALGQCAG